jgi:hypothetical protein
MIAIAATTNLTAFNVFPFSLVFTVRIPKLVGRLLPVPVSAAFMINLAGSDLKDEKRNHPFGLVRGPCSIQCAPSRHVITVLYSKCVAAFYEVFN